MAATRNRRHLLVPGEPQVEPYARHPTRIETPPLPAPESRAAHGAALKTELSSAVDEARERRQAQQDAGVVVHGATPGIYVQFESQPGVPLNLMSLEAQRSGIELVAVTRREVVATATEGTDTGATATPAVDTADAEDPEGGEAEPPKPLQVESATVFVPEGKVGHFLKRFEAYAQDTPREKGETRYEDVFDRVAELRLATLKSLWTDDASLYPEESARIWWEVWLRRVDGRELERFMEFATLTGIDVSERRLQFDDRTVVLARATPSQLVASTEVIADVAEVRKAKETAKAFLDMPPSDQWEWTDELVARVSGPQGDVAAVCILDTGVTRAHPLLEAAISAADCTAVDPSWGSHDDGGGPGLAGHGTQMAGLALYGDLTSVLESTATVALRHRLESVKILPPRGANNPELYGAVTAEAAGRAEIQAPHRRRCFNLAVTSDDQRDRGQPTSWSAAIDALAAGRVFEPSSQGLVYLDEDELDGDEAPSERRLFVVSAGNVQGLLDVNHLDRSDTEPVHDPAHAWNALTVGAYTELVNLGPERDNWTPVAKAGDLSPWSTTSVTFQKQWPIKPDVVLEGGNAAHNAASEVDFPIDELSLLTTHHVPAEKPFAISYATSAATAQAARMAAIIRSEYPSLWPEAVRALIVHSARWTPTMLEPLSAARRKRDRENLVRRYGFGVPRVDRALRSANDSLTLIAQGTIHPFVPGAQSSTRRMGDAHFFELPWPTEALQELGAATVRLRVTLSYFVEPNPARRGWVKRYRYASHGLRFDLKAPTETMETFRKRLNALALEEDEDKPDGATDPGWFLGPTARSRGSLHTDFFEANAADVASSGVVGVFPVSGWWKDQPKRDRSHLGARYALVVSIETDAADVDIWTPVAAKIGVPISIDSAT